MAQYLRRASIEDAKEMLRWRNDPKTRENSFSKGEIDLASHLKWLERKLAQENCHIFILEDEGVGIGSIRVDVSDGVGEISYMIAPEARGKGYGKLIIRLLEEELKKSDAGITTLTAFTLKDNPASGRCFVANGYSAEDAGDSYCYSKALE